MAFDSSILDEQSLRTRTADPMDDAQQDTLVEKAQHLLRTRWWVIAQAVVVIPAAVLVLSLLQSKSWTATSTLNFQPPRQSSGSVDLTRQAQTQADLVALPIVAERAAQSLGGGWTPRAVQDVVSVHSTGDTNLVEVDGTAPDPAAAARLADTYAASFVALQDEANVSEAKHRLKVLDDYFQSLPADERSGPRGQRLQQRLDGLRISQGLQSNDQQPSARVVQRAQLPDAPSSPKTVRNVVLAFILAVALGIALAALLDRLDRAIKSVDELERLYRLPVLGRIPRARGLAKRLRRQGAAEVLRQGPEAEAFRALRAGLRYFNVDGNLRSLLVVSPETEDGKSTVAACLATTYAQRGDRTILVEADLHKRRDGDKRRSAGTSPAGIVGGAGSGGGLSDVLAGGDLDDAIQTVPLWAGDREVRELDVLPSGPTPPNASELLESRRMRELMTELSRRYDMVIYDSPAMDAVSDALALVPHIGGVLIVSRLRYTGRDSARNLLKQLALLRGNVLGVVANYAETPKKRGYDYYHP
jgi:capsular exopolysaccharide synthesis family protein